jgi:hypothetical protein
MRCSRPSDALQGRRRDSRRPTLWTCRKTLADYNEAMRVIVPVDDENPIARAVDLLPTRTW